MNREQMLSQLSDKDNTFDIVVIGGGATGIGIALEASARNYSVLLLEQADFAKGTSSRSTKLIHGGVRYLAQGNIVLVKEALKERGLIAANAPHLVKDLSFVIPTHNLWEELKYTIGLKLYDWFAGKLSLGASKRVTRSEALKRITTFNPDKLSAGVVYHDAQFDDSRLAINAVQTAAELGAVVINYCPVNSIVKDEGGKIVGVQCVDAETGVLYTVKAKQVINAAGVFADAVIQMDTPQAKNVITPSQGVHLVLDKHFLPGNDAIMIPKTDDGRVLFLVPWHDKVVVGTTDTPINSASLEPVALEEEIAFILSTAARYLSKAPHQSDVLSVFAGLRPLAAASGEGKTKEISRSHKIIASQSGLLTMVGGKWTTFRKMGEDMLDAVEKRNGWKHIASKTAHLKIHGYSTQQKEGDSLSFYGSDADEIRALAKQLSMEEVLSEDFGVLKVEVVWAVQQEMARTVEDFLARRRRCQVLNAKESIQMASEVAKIMAAELGKDEHWQKQQVQQYMQVTKNYIL